MPQRHGVGANILMIVNSVSSGIIASPPRPWVDVFISGPQVQLMAPTLELVNTFVIQSGSEEIQSGPGMEGLANYLDGCENIESIRAISKRQVELFTTDWPGGNPGRGVLYLPADASPNDGVAYDSTIHVLFWWTYATWYRSMFLGYNGGSVWSVIKSGGAPGIMRVSEAGIRTAGLEYEYFPSSQGEYATLSGVAQFSVPSRTPFLWKFGRTARATVTGTGRSISILTGIESDANFHLTVYYAAKDDFTVGGYLCSPTIIIEASPEARAERKFFIKS